jgi:hypothetical protein
MPIVLGNTTITGLAAGGLPSSVITDSNLNYAGAVIGVTTFQSNTRIVTSSSANVTYYSFTVTKKRTNSILIAHGCTPVGGSTNHGIYWFVDFGGNRVFRGFSDGWRVHGPVGDVSPSSIPGGFFFSTPSPTGISAGNVTVGVGIQPIDGSSNRPYNVLNPTTSDDGRHNCGTNVIVYEVTT